jgi:hypothetical protein
MGQPLNRYEHIVINERRAQDHVGISIDVRGHPFQKTRDVASVRELDH